MRQTHEAVLPRPIAVPRRAGRVRGGQLLAHSLYVAAVAALANELLGLAAVSAFDIAPAFEPLRPGGAAISTVTATLGAALVLLATFRFTGRPEGWFLGISWAVLALSFVPVVLLALNPAEIPATTPPGIAALGAMHLVAFAIVVPWLLRLARRVRRVPEEQSR